MARAGLVVVRVNLRRLHFLLVAVVLAAMACELVILHVQVNELERRVAALEHSSP